MQSTEYQLKSFVIEHRIDIQYTISKYMREQLRCIAEMKKNKTKFKDKPIKKYFIMKSTILKKNKKRIYTKLLEEEEYSESDESE